MDKPDFHPLLKKIIIIIIIVYDKADNDIADYNSHH